MEILPKPASGGIQKKATGAGRDFTNAFYGLGILGLAGLAAVTLYRVGKGEYNKRRGKSATPTSANPFPGAI